MMGYLGEFAIAFFVSFIAMPIFMGILRMFGLYVVVQEQQCVVFELFGKVRQVITQPGLHSPWTRMGPLAMLLPLFGKKFVVDMRRDQTYLRSQTVNSEEGAPMGIGVWCEMNVSDPIAYLYKNNDPLGSLRANISNATVRSLSNLKLSEMLENRHSMSRTVRKEVSSKSKDWGYDVGSVYIRKVHFRDYGMIRQIEEKVVNRLRQVTGAIQQDGANRVSVIRSTAERQAAKEFARAAATRPRIVGAALSEIAQNQAIASAMFEVLETQNLIKSKALEVNVIPQGTPIVYEMAGNGR
ncbi:MAG: SPFH domain-containing protein [Polyangiaceae bacterium]|nr:SPFH domain-containing protein [Polyangiaceae bacterium]MCW5792050.1 SPFH domain-containing protein [Polyangiaceae bacterium]